MAQQEPNAPKNLLWHGYGIEVTPNAMQWDDGDASISSRAIDGVRIEKRSGKEYALGLFISAIIWMFVPLPFGWLGAPMAGLCIIAWLFLRDYFLIVMVSGDEKRVGERMKKEHAQEAAEAIRAIMS